MMGGTSQRQMSHLVCHAGSQFDDKGTNGASLRMEDKDLGLPKASKHKEARKRDTEPDTSQGLTRAMLGIGGHSQRVIDVHKHATATDWSAKGSAKASKGSSQ